MTLPVIILRIDTSGTAFGVAPTWTDRTSYLLTAGDGEPIGITWGRQDEQGEPQPATCSFLLDNTTGFWTPGNAAAPANWDVGCPVNVRVTANATTYDRFTGLVDSIEPTWPGGVQSWSVVKVTATDVSARLGLSQPLKSLAQQEMLADGPTYLYPLTEASGATSGGSIVGSVQTAYPTTTLGGGSAVFGYDMGLFESSGGVDMTANTETELTYLSIAAAAPSAGPFTFELEFISPTSIPATTALTIWQEQRGASPGGLALVVNSGTGRLVFTCNDGGSSSVVSDTVSICDALLHHVVCTLGADRKTVTITVDGSRTTSVVGASVLTFSAAGAAALGANYLGSYGAPVVVSHVAMYPSALSTGRALAHYQAGVGIGPVERSDLRFARIAAYGGITTSGLPTGDATMGGQRTAGVTAIDALKTVARTEGTVAYVTPAGALTFQDRGLRYHTAVGLSLTADDVAGDFMPRRDRQNQFNELTVLRDGGADQVVTDLPRQAADGRRDGGSFTVASSTDDDALQNASWQVANHKTPSTRVPSLTLDLLAQPTAAKVASCLAATISTKVQVTGLPSQAPTSTFTGFIEGASETIGVQSWSISFFTSPIVLEDLTLVLDDATYGHLDTGLLAF